MAKYRAGVIGLGWMGMLFDLGTRDEGMWHVDDIDRPTPELDIHRTFHYHQQAPGKGNYPITYTEALHDRPDVDLVAGAERDTKRLQVFSERYGVTALYTDAAEMLRNENLDIVCIATNTKGRADLTCLAVQSGAKGIMTEKPMAHTLEEADRMVKACADAEVPLVCGAITKNHPSFAKAKELVEGGAIGEVLSIEGSSFAQHSQWSYFISSEPAWVVGTGDLEPLPTGSNEFQGQGMMATTEGLMVHFRKGTGQGVRITGSAGEITFDYEPSGWRLWQDIENPAAVKRVEMPWPDPQMPHRMLQTVYGIADVIDCIEDRLDEPKASGRRQAMGLEVEIALKLSSAGGAARIDLPLADRSLGLNYDWYR